MYSPRSRLTREDVQRKATTRRSAALATQTQSDTDANLSSALTPEQEKIIHLQQTRGNAAVARYVQQRKQDKAGSAKPPASRERLPVELGGTLDSLFGESVSQVQLHTGLEADTIAREADTNAVSVGGDIYFREGAYQPGTAEGNAIIARELTHVVRHRAAGHSIQRTPHTYSSAEQDEALDISGIVRDMGPDPAGARHSKPAANAVQRSVVQRLDTAHVGGVVLSKFMQGLGNFLGPLGILWRWPLIRKNFREFGGMDKTTGQVKDENMWRYGFGPLATLMRAISMTAEITKEITTWLSFATFIASVLTVASLGGAAPVAAGLALATLTMGSLTALLKLITFGYNAIRLVMGKVPDNQKNMVKHQLWSDGMDALSGAISAVFAGFGMMGALAKAAGESVPAFTSIGSSIGKSISGGASTVGGTIGGKVISDTLVSPSISTLTNVPKEGGKLAYKAPKQGEGGFKTGFFKDWEDIKLGYKGAPKPPPPPIVQQDELPIPPQVQDNNIQPPNPDDVPQEQVNVPQQVQDNNLPLPNPEQIQGEDVPPPVPPRMRENIVPPPIPQQDGEDGNVEPPVMQQALDVQQGPPPKTVAPDPQQAVLIQQGDKQLDDIEKAGPRNVSESEQFKQDSAQVNDQMKDGFGSIPTVVGQVAQVTETLKTTEKETESTDQQVNQGISQIKGDGEAENVLSKVKEGLAKSDEIQVSGLEKTSGSVSEVDSQVNNGKDKNDDDMVQTVRRKPSLFSRIKNWFSRKIRGIKKGARMLSSKLMMGMLNFIGKFTKNGNELRDANAVIGASMQQASQNQAAEVTDARLAVQMATQTKQMREQYEKAKRGG